MSGFELPTRDDWKLLGIDPTESLSDAKRAYRLAARASHPDRGGSAASFRQATDAWLRIAAALEWRDAHGLASAVSVEEDEAEEIDEEVSSDVDGYSSPARSAESCVTVPLFERLVRKIGRAIFLAGRFPERDWAALLALAVGACAPIALHSAVQPGWLANSLALLVLVVVVGRIVALPSRLGL